MKLSNLNYILQYKFSPDPKKSGYEVNYLQSGKLTFDTFPDHLPKHDALSPQYAFDTDQPLSAECTYLG
ncbi:ATPase [Novimethylophilus kurashikiensis]|uniref:ATPase n=1 Tax=Novimethylophilus kurashikiensis TaxID=1825523 RepID=A0A2R5FCS5_9PROT|nr:hypothetical protein [Novimethylophilus kurashikiensis]GBG16012.1 ATPase [Novimethylophilus kurashikiensis]